MPISADTLHELCPGVDERLVAAHVKRLEDACLRCFNPEVAAHRLERLTQLDGAHPVDLIIDVEVGGLVACPVLAFDHVFEFSLITGILAGTGFTITSGDVFTFKGVAIDRAPGRRPRRPSGVTARRDPFAQAVIIDHFRGKLLERAGGFDA